VFCFLRPNLLIVLLSAFYRKQKKKYPGGSADNVLRGLEKHLLHFYFTGAVIMTVFGFFGALIIPAFFTSLSIVAAAIAILAKDFIAEIISGIIISFFEGKYTSAITSKLATTKAKITDINFTKNCPAE
jgi:MscS family membrane protein